MNSLEIVKELIKGIDEYESKTGRKNPPAYVSKDLLKIIEKDLEVVDLRNKIINYTTFTGRGNITVILSYNQIKELIKNQNRELNIEWLMQNLLTRNIKLEVKQ